MVLNLRRVCDNEIEHQPSPLNVQAFRSCFDYFRCSFLKSFLLFSIIV